MILETRPLMIFLTVYINWRMRMLHSKSINQNEKGIGERGVYFTSIDDLSNFASIYDIIDMLVAALLIQLSEDININKTLVTWRNNSLELP